MFSCVCFRLSNSSVSTILVLMEWFVTATVLFHGFRARRALNFYGFARHPKYIRPARPEITFQAGRHFRIAFGRLTIGGDSGILDTQLEIASVEEREYNAHITLTFKPVVRDYVYHGIKNSLGTKQFSF